MLKQKHVDAAREVRLWMSQVIIPIGGIIVMTNPKVSSKVNEGVNNVKNKVRGVFNK